LITNRAAERRHCHATPIARKLRDAAFARRTNKTLQRLERLASSEPRSASSKPKLAELMIVKISQTAHRAGS
jgi:hypothetical protein